MPASYEFSLSPRWSVGAAAAGMALVAAPFAVMIAAFGDIHTAVQWCQDRLVAAGYSSEDLVVVAAIAAVATAGAIGFGRLVHLAVAETKGRIRFEEAATRQRLSPDRRAMRAAEKAGVASVDVLLDTEPYALTVGLFRPRIVISSALFESCNDKELVAVLSHEQAHARGFHPLKALAWEALSRLASFAPAVRDVASHLALAREVEADTAATSVVGRRTVASAMLKAVEMQPVSAMAAFGRIGDRAIALVDPERSIPLRVQSSRLIATAAIFLLGSVLASTLGMRAASAAKVDLCDSGHAPMSMINFSPYHSIRLEQMSAAPPGHSPAIEDYGLIKK